jgi:hypothetical protein
MFVPFRSSANTALILATRSREPLRLRDTRGPRIATACTGPGSAHPFRQNTQLSRSPVDTPARGAGCSRRQPSRCYRIPSSGPGLRNGAASSRIAPERNQPQPSGGAIARKLGLREDVTRYLSNTGILSDREDGRPTPNGLGFFSRDFVTAIELGAQFEKSPRAAWLQLRDLGILPAFGPPTCRQIIYRRPDAERALSAACLLPTRRVGPAAGRMLPN